MQRQTAVVCEGCGNPYAARLVEDEVILSTDDGRCACGNDTFVRVEEADHTRGGTTG